MSGGTGSLMSVRGAGDLLTRTTWILGTIFFVLALLLTIVAGRQRGAASVVDRLKVNAINPGLTESEGLQGNSQFDAARAPTVASRAIKREMKPEDMVGTLLYLCTPDSDFVTGQCLNVDGGKINA